MNVFLQAALLIWGLMTLLWLISILLKNVSIVDLFWGFSFVLINAFYVFISGELNPRKILILVLVSIWGLRLTVYLFIRNWGKGEDFRYKEFRRKYGEERYWWFSYFQTFLLQGALVLIVSLPLYGINTSNDPGTLNFIDYAGITIWLIGFVFESGGDYQLARFKRDKRNRGRVLDKGFWKYTRHPNYFGDAAVWWAYAILSISAGAYWHIIGSAVMTYLLLRVSGVSLLEKSLKDSKPEYQDYVRKTNSFFPWFPQK